MRRRRKWIVALVVAVAVVWGGRLWLGARSRPKAPELAGEVVTVQRGTVQKTVSADGSLRALTTVEVKSYAGGAIDMLAVDVGDRVKAGDLIAVIDPTDSRTTHDVALADLSVAKASLAKARANLRVQDTLTAATIAQAQAGEATASQELSRIQDASQPLTRAQARSALDEALAAQDSAERSLEKLQTADHPQATVQIQSDIARFTAALEAARQDLGRLKQADQPQATAAAKAAVDGGTASLSAAKENLGRLQQADNPQAKALTVSDMAKARSDLNVAAKELDRARSLRADGLISQSDLDVAESTYASRKADFDYAEARVAAVEPGQTRSVKAAEMAVEQAAATLASAQERWRTLAQQQSAEVKAAEAKVDQANADLSAVQNQWLTLEPKQTAEVRVAQANVEQAKAQVASAAERWRTIDKDQQAETKTAEAKVSEAEAGVSTAEAGQVQRELRQTEVQTAEAQVTKAQAQVANAAIMLGYTTITAPRNGVVLQRLVEQGTIITSGRSSVSSGTTIVLLGDTTEMFVDVKIDETDLPNVTLGQSVNIRVEAYPDRSAEGKVTRVDPQATTDQNITTVLVEVEVVHPDDTLLPGLTATCEFLVSEVADALYVPRRAVEVIDGEASVKAMQDGTPVATPVKIGLEGDESTEILEGIEEGTEVFLPRLGTGSAPTMSKGQEMGRKMGGGGFSTR